MFQIYVLDQKVQGKKTSTTFLIFFLNAMIRNIKIHNIIDIIEISISMEPNTCIQKKNNENVHLIVSYDFSKFNGSRKIKV
jgi:hypothetical protein